MSLPANFSTPHEELHRYFRNLCIKFQKTIRSVKDIQPLQEEIEDFKDASKQMDWHNANTAVFHKQEGEKAVGKVLTEYQRYTKDLSTHPTKANPQDLLNALLEVQRLIDALKVT